MPSPTFLSALSFVLRWEGGFVDHPDDPGGRTNKGVTQTVYDTWRTRHGDAQQDVKQIRDDEVETIYDENYWMPPRCDLLDAPLTLVQFDTAVNMGVKRAVRFLQTSVGCTTDGDFGPGTRDAVVRCDRAQSAIAFCDAREAYYKRLVEATPKLAVFLKGWLNRLGALRKEIGLSGYEGLAPLDFGDTGYIKRIPDLGENAAYDL